MPDRANSPPEPDAKLDVRLDVNVPEQMKDDAAFVARARGFRNTGEWVRSVLIRELYGSLESIQRLVEQRTGVDGRNRG